MNLKLDELTTILSNVTKVNHKCRDIYLLFRSILAYGSSVSHSENKDKNKDKDWDEESVGYALLIRVFDNAYSTDKDKDKTTKTKIMKGTLPSSSDRSASPPTN